MFSSIIIVNVPIETLTECKVTHFFPIKAQKKQSISILSAFFCIFAPDFIHY